MTSDQAFGPLVPPRTATRPSKDTILTGRFVTVVGLQLSYTSVLYEELCGPSNDWRWDYKQTGPFNNESDWAQNISNLTSTPDLDFFTILLHQQDGSKRPVGLCSLRRADLTNRVIELGGLIFGPRLTRSRAGSEAMYLVMKHVFEDLGFRRLEWKANRLNVESERAARRLGFVFEGCFRQHLIVKGRNRDSVWLSMLDGEWEGRKKALEEWLDDGNFDEEGRQKRRLEEFRK